MKKQEIGPKQEIWLQALESGEYKQTTGAMCVFGRYCCLGVARKVLGIKRTGSVDLGNGYRELGLYSSNGQSNFCTKPSLASLNDEYKKSFEEIAEIIREDPSMYFAEVV